MSKPNDGGPAFPAYTIIETKDELGRNRTAIVNSGGMSLRAHFAGEALKGMLSNPWTSAYLKEHFNDADAEGRWYVVQSVRAADALIAELDKEQ